jgi:hypothetical protein
MEFKLTIGFNPESLAAINAFVSALSGSKTPATNGKVVKITEAAAPGAASANGAPAPSSNGTIAPASLKIETIRAEQKVKADNGKRAEIKALLSEFGADSLTTLDPSQYSSYFIRLKAL